jgi:hypothetical protein
LNPIIAYVSGKNFDRVIHKPNSHTEDFWFVWPDDYEPIRIIHENNKITSVLHRFHWMHRNVNSPYLNDRGRVEALFIPLGHTPMVRKSKLDLDFYILIKSFSSQRIEDYDVADEDVPQYYMCSGRKDRHFPPVEYDGWPELQ